jgi:hypothetical protein
LLCPLTAADGKTILWFYLEEEGGGGCICAFVICGGKFCWLLGIGKFRGREQKEESRGEEGIVLCSVEDFVGNGRQMSTQFDCVQIQMLPILLLLELEMETSLLNIQQSGSSCPKPFYY